jgi:hypothetical protein
MGIAILPPSPPIHKDHKRKRLEPEESLIYYGYLDCLSVNLLSPGSDTRYSLPAPTAYQFYASGVVEVTQELADILWLS